GATDHFQKFAEDWFPIQVKQVDKVGRPDIDAFEAVMEREGEHGRSRGFFVAFGYSRDAEQECAAFHKRTGRIIKLLTVQEILNSAISVLSRVIAVLLALAETSNVSA